MATLTRREAAAVRRATRHDSAMGSDEFLQNLELTYQIRLRALPVGRPRNGPSTEVPMQVSFNYPALGTIQTRNGPSTEVPMQVPANQSASA